MGLGDWLKRHLGDGSATETALPETLDIPLFPLGTVLFPGGVLGLKIFEARYLDMAAACLREDVPFGVCLIAEGKDTGTPAVPHPVGTLARLTRCDMEQPGILLASAQGGRRFRIVERRIEANGLQRARVELLAEPPAAAVPEALAGLAPLARRIAADLGVEKMPPPHDFADALWLGYRLAEAMPVQPLAKQKLLELDDPLSRLEILHTYLAQRGLVQ
ncbi:LON peptidase substrate-binding domain-containing protein [Oryzomicrobium sp.]|uniref:LON peptidase substrate-binding domain-containing protein n=1 Tax=Oryzomicrobium sp. TaxID=1911578 RepID=UPI002FE352A0